MSETAEAPEMEKCPGCDLRLPADALVDQVEHMRAKHPEIVEQRLSDARFVRNPRTGQWEDPWASD